MPRASSSLSLVASPGRRVAALAVLVIVALFELGAQEPGILRVGGDIDYRPYSFTDASGEPSGFDVELMRLLAERLGLEPRIDLGAWDAVLQDLQAGHIDVVVGTLFTISRTDHFIFTEPYNTDTVSIFVRQGSSIDSLRQLDGCVAAVLEGDAIPEVVLNTSGIEPEIRTYPTFTEALWSVSDGVTDYTLIPYAVGMELSESAGIDNLEVTGPPVYTIQYRLAVHRSQEGFRDQLNHELNALIDTDEYRELQNTWLRHERQELSVDTVFRYVAPVVIPGGVILLVAWVWTLKRQVARQTEELATRSAELQAQATEDALTGLANRRLFTTIAEKEFPRAQRRGEVFSLLFIDLDHFKAVNDTYGHPVGDRVLEEFARRASKALRDYDTLARYGGEEFVALLRDADRDEALGVAKRVWTACRSTGFEFGEAETRVFVTTSVGVAVLSRDDQSFHQVLRRADEALYRAKNAGRDRVLVD